MDDGTILETNDRGELEIPAGVLGAGPHARFRLQHDGAALRLIPEAFVGQEVSPESRAATFRRWVTQLPARTAAPIAADELHRENLYD